MPDLIGTWQHYKGGLYKVIGEATHTETSQDLVIYTDSEGRFWARPKDMFLGNLPAKGLKQKLRRVPPVPRFERVIEHET